VVLGSIWIAGGAFAQERGDGLVPPASAEGEREPDDAAEGRDAPGAEPGFPDLPDADAPDVGGTPAVEPELPVEGPAFPEDCELVAELAHEGTRHLACAGWRRVWVVTEDAVRSFEVEGYPEALFLRRDEVWVEVSRRIAHPLGQPPPLYADRRGPRPTPLAPPTYAPRLVPEAPPEAEGESYWDRFAPERTPGIEAGLYAYPLLGGGFGLVTDAWIDFRAQRVFVGRIVLDPLAVAFPGEEGEDRFGSYHLRAMLGLDHRYFGITAGVGVMHARFSDFGTTRRIDGPGATMTFEIRLGARDGFHFQVSNSILFASGESLYAQTTAEWQIPLTAGKWLLFRGGGGGPIGYGAGSVGLRILVAGDGGSGSVFVTPLVGGGGVFDALAFDRSAAGFTTSLGVEVRP